MIKSSSKSRATKRIVSELDGYVRAYCLERDGNQCNKCGSGPDSVLQAAHVLSKGPYGRIRFEPHNVMILCLKHHLYWWHKSPLEAWEWFESTFPGRKETLQIAARNAPKLDLKLLLTVWRGRG